jgi:NAD(P)-dependent dehydrogenase (short-subunit alcohol dehydrogenase family)
MQITGRGVVITGGKRIGADVALALASRGADVALVFNRSRAEADAAAAAIVALGRRGFVLHADLADPVSCRRVIDDAALSLGRLDVLVNMASVYESRPLDDLKVEDWNQSLEIDLRATHLCTHAAIPHMRHQRGGRVINFTDWIAASGRPRYTGYVPYYVAKAGVVGLTEALALELAADQILVNAVAPGPILAPPGTSDEERLAVERATPLGRWGGPAEISKAVAFLVETDFVTGETIRVDGGRHLK